MHDMTKRTETDGRDSSTSVEFEGGWGRHD